jgi:hypothetical protein
MPLSPAQQALLSSAAPSFIETEFHNLRTNWASNQWLSNGNRYTADCVKQIKKDTGGSKGVSHRHLREYIAASAVPHCMDGWSYLGGAIDAHLRGDADVSRHLGYYAELRAAMAILATEGIGIFNDKHFVVTRNGSCARINGQTHQFVWDALEGWALTPQASNLIFSIIRPGSITLGEWLNHFCGGAFRTTLINHWLKQWGLDLQRLRDDRESRNIASYRPTSFTSSRATPVTDALDFVSEFWSICEPTAMIRFPKLDRYLLRESLDLSFRVTHPHKRSRKQAKKLFHTQVKMMLYHLTPTDLTADQWEAFLSYSNSSEPSPILEEAKGVVGPTHPNHHRQVLSRATLLLRLAIGACEAKLASLPGVVPAELQFWWSALGEDRSLWDTGNPPAEFRDLWKDILDGMRDIDAWRKGPPSGSISYNTLWREQAIAAGVFGTCERIALWGLGL